MEDIKKIKIECPAGYEIDKEKSTFSEVVFKRIIKDFWYEKYQGKPMAGFFVNSCSKIQDIYILSANETSRNIVPEKIQAESMLAFAQLCMLMSDKKYAFDNSCTYAYIITKLYGDKNVTLNVSKLIYRINDLLLFGSREQATEFLEQHKELICKYYMIDNYE